jgi:hypothetical protein
MYETSSVHSAVANLSAAVRGAMEQAIPRGYSPKKNYFHRRFENKASDYFYDRFALYRKRVKSTIKSDRLR